LKKQSQFPGALMNVKSFQISDYDDFCRFETAKKQSQFKPNQSQFAGLWPEILNKMNGCHLTEQDLKKQSQFAKGQMDATICCVRSYGDNSTLRLWENKPKQSQFQTGRLLIDRMCRKFLLPPVLNHKGRHRASLNRYGKSLPYMPTTRPACGFREAPGKGP
jgi:hypothetical protein